MTIASRFLSFIMPKTRAFKGILPAQDMIARDGHNATLSRKYTVEGNIGRKLIIEETFIIHRLKEDVYIMEYTTKWANELIIYMKIGYESSSKHFCILERAGKSRDILDSINSLMPIDKGYETITLAEWDEKCNDCPPFVSKSTHHTLGRRIINADDDQIVAIMATICIA